MLYEVITVLLVADGYGDIRLRRWLHRLWIACVESGRQVAAIAAILLCASIIVGVFNMTGIGVKITSLILSASGGNLWIALILRITSYNVCYTKLLRNV